jgi:hypothetical protein
MQPIFEMSDWGAGGDKVIPFVNLDKEIYKKN